MVRSVAATGRDCCRELLSGLRTRSLACAPIRILVQLGCAIVAIAAVTPVRAADNGPLSFVINEPVERNWTNERVSFSVASDVAAQLPHDAALVDAAGREVLHEIVKTDSGTSIEMLVDLAANETRTFRFDTGRRVTAVSDLRVVETGYEIALSNNKGGVKLRKFCSASEGPVVALRLTEGGWLTVRHSPKDGVVVTGCATEIVRRGPVLAVAVATWTFTTGHTARLTFQLQAGDAAVQVDEAWSSSRHPAYDLSFDSGSDTLGVYFRTSRGNDFGRVALQYLRDEEKAFELEPWVRWWIAERRNTWAAFYSGDESQLSDVLMIATIRAADWINAAEASNNTIGRNFRLVLRSSDSQPLATLTQLS